MLYYQEIMIQYPTRSVPTTEGYIFGCLSHILEYQEDIKRLLAALSITCIGQNQYIDT